jgi:DNA-binding SARP family transcriptional activator
MDLAEIGKQLRHLERRYQEWVEPINRAFREKMFQVNGNGYTHDDFEREMAQIRERQLAEYDPYEETYTLLDELGPAYLVASAEERTTLRKAFSDKNGLLSALLGYGYRCAEKVRHDADEDWLLRGLSAVSLENCSKDYRDVLLLLAELYVAAEEAGIDPKPAFRRVARLSSNAIPRGGNSSVRRMMANLKGYGVLQERRQRSGKRRGDSR